jgi:hypothetical protein
VLSHLAWRGVADLFVAHYPAGGWRSPTEAAIFRGLGTVPGVPDLLIVHAGHLYCLELKAAGGRLTDIQLATQARLRAAGATVATAVELDAALAQLEQWKLLRPDVSARRAS